MKNFTLVHETPSHFVLHNGVSHFHVAKNGISEPTAIKIRALAKGGKPLDAPSWTKKTDSEPGGSAYYGDITTGNAGMGDVKAADAGIPSDSIQNYNAQNYDEGGKVQPRNPAAETPPNPDAYQATPLPQDQEKKDNKLKKVEVNMDASEFDNFAGGGNVTSPTKTSTETGGSSPGGASTGGVGSGLGGAGTGGAATGGASTGGAGTITQTASGSSKAKSNISDVGGSTHAGNTTSGKGPGSPGIGGKGSGPQGGGGAAPDEPKNFAQGGKLDANARSHIAPHNFALPGRRYPIEDVNHARNALARVAQHGTPEEKARVALAVHSKYPGIHQQLADGGEVSPTHTATETGGSSPGGASTGGVGSGIGGAGTGGAATGGASTGGAGTLTITVSGKTKLAKGAINISNIGGRTDAGNTTSGDGPGAVGTGGSGKGSPGGNGATPDQPPKMSQGGQIQKYWDGTADVEPTPTPSPQDSQDKSNELANVSQSFNSATHNGIQKKAQGGSIQNETQDQAIKRYADGNPATLSKGGVAHTHHNAGKNQLHFHFYDGGNVPTQLDEYEQQSPANGTPLDNYVKLANGGSPTNEIVGDDVPVTASKLESAYGPEDDSAKLASAAQDVQQGTDSQNNMISAADKDSTTSPAAAPSSVPSPTDSSSSISVPPEQQISAVPKPLPPSADQNPNMLSDFDKNLAMEKQGIEEGAAAQSQGFKSTAQAIGENQLQQKAIQDEYKFAADNLTIQNDNLLNQVASQKIDPNHFWNSKTAGGKIAATIGLLLGGIGGGLNGTNQNQALAMLQTHVQNDIEAQKNDQSNKLNLYKIGLERYRDERSAQQFATMQSNALLQGTLQKIAAQTGNTQAQASAKQMMGQLGLQNASIRSELAMKQAAMNIMNGPAQPAGGVNPNNLRILVNSGVIPKEEVPTAMKEYGDYNKLSDTLDHTDQVFKQASQNANYTQRLANSLPLGSHLPTVRDSSKAYEAITNAWLGNITKDTEGRVTPTDVDLMRTSLPQAGDPPALQQTKLNNIKDMIRDKYSFPTLTANRLLHPNDPVATSNATRQKRFTEGPPK